MVSETLLTHPLPLEKEGDTSAAVRRGIWWYPDPSSATSSPTCRCENEVVRRLRPSAFTPRRPLVQVQLRPPHRRPRLFAWDEAVRGLGYESVETLEEAWLAQLP